jgi:hypothetical protein avisC_05722
VNEDRQRARFTPRARQNASRLHDRENLDAELALIRDRIDFVVAHGREEFYDGAQAYDVACMVIIRLAALLERAEFMPYLVTISEDERRAIRTTRNIAAHAGYRSMDDSLFWVAITRRVPEILDRIQAGG